MITNRTYDAFISFIAWFETILILTTLGTHGSLQSICFHAKVWCWSRLTALVGFLRDVLGRQQFHQLLYKFYCLGPLGRIALLDYTLTTPYVTSWFTQEHIHLPWCISEWGLAISLQKYLLLLLHTSLIWFCQKQNGQMRRMWTMTDIERILTPHEGSWSQLVAAASFG